MNADKLRQIADYLDSMENMALNVWGLSADPRKDEAMADIRSRHMQHDLRRWADELEDVREG